MELQQPAEAAEQMRHAGETPPPGPFPHQSEILKAGPHIASAVFDQPERLRGRSTRLRRRLGGGPASRPTRFDLPASAPRKADRRGLARIAELAAESPTEARVWELGGQIAFSQPGHLEFARDWTAEAVAHFPEDQSLLVQRAEALLLNQDAAEALPLWRRAQPAGSPRQRAAVVLCELLTGECQYHFTAAEEPALSQEAVQWYRQGIRWARTP